MASVDQGEQIQPSPAQILAEDTPKISRKKLKRKVSSDEESPVIIEPIVEAKALIPNDTTQAKKLKRREGKQDDADKEARLDRKDSQSKMNRMQRLSEEPDDGQKRPHEIPHESLTSETSNPVYQPTNLMHPYQQQPQQYPKSQYGSVGGIGGSQPPYQDYQHKFSEAQTNPTYQNPGGLAQPYPTYQNPGGMNQSYPSIPQANIYNSSYQPNPHVQAVGVDQPYANSQVTGSVNINHPQVAEMDRNRVEEEPSAKQRYVSERNAFIRKVFSLVGIQLAITFFFVALVTGIESLQKFVNTNVPLLVICWVMTFFIIILVFCTKKYSKHYPYNYIALFSFVKVT